MNRGAIPSGARRLPVLLPLLLALALGACGSSLNGRTDDFVAPAADGGAPETDTLAESHEITVEADDDAIPASFAALLEACRNEQEAICEVLDATLRSGDAPSAFVSLRAEPALVANLSRTAIGDGRVLSQSTHAEDLARPMADAAERIAMLERYVADLEALREREDNDTADLIAIAEELAETLTRLDAIRAERANLERRVRLDVLDVQWRTATHGRPPNPIGRALGDFGQSLAEGVGQTITALAFMLPWSVLVIPVLLLLRRLWRRGS